MADNRKAVRLSDDPRTKCYDEMRACMEKCLRDYYVAHPDRLLDQRSLEKIEMMKLSLACMLRVLDGYAISHESTHG